MSRLQIMAGLFLLSMLITALAACAPSSNSATTQTAVKSALSQPTAAISVGEALLNERCTICHSTDQIKADRKTPDEWKLTVERMITNEGAKLSGEERFTIIQYLSVTYGTPVAVH